MVDVAGVIKTSALNAIDMKNSLIDQKVIYGDYLIIKYLFINKNLLVNNLYDWEHNRCRLIICWMRFFGVRLFAVTNSQK